MISIIVGTNLRNSKSLHIANYLKEKNGSCQVLDLSTLSNEFISPSMYFNQHIDIQEAQDRFLIECNHWIIVMPEYNGTFPGILKLFLDACSVRNYNKTFVGKKIWMIGLGSGRGGNLRGIDHLSTAMLYMGCHIFPKSMPISNIGQVISEDGHILVDQIANDLEVLLSEFENF
jgi:NAD(P)H-dependent FMN reductase